jgi:hypothetical protein
MARNSPRGTPARVILVFALLMAVVVISAWRDWRAGTLSRVSWPSAVGDGDFYMPGSGPLAVTVEGRIFSLFEESGERLRMRDDQMWRVPLAVSTPRVYAVEERLPEDVVPKLYVKIAHGEYLQMRLEPAGPG